MLHAPVEESKLRCGGIERGKEKEKRGLEMNVGHNDSDEKSESEMVRKKYR